MSILEISPHQGCCGGTRSRCCRCLLTGCKGKKKNWFPAHNQTEPDPPEIIIITSQGTYFPEHEGFCPEDADKAFTSGCEMHTVPITGQAARACYFHQRMLSRGTFSCQPGETSHWRKLEPPNAFSSSPSPALAVAQEQILLQKMSTSGARWFLPCSAATSQTAWKTLKVAGGGGSFKWTRRTVHRAGAMVKVKIN